MSIISENWRTEDAGFGLKMVIKSGRATADEVDAMKKGVVTRFKLVPIPNARGAIFKILDGSEAETETVKTLTTGETFTVLKISSDIQPMAPQQAETSPWAGKAIVRFEIRYHEVGEMA